MTQRPQPLEREYVVTLTQSERRWLIRLVQGKRGFPVADATYEKLRKCREEAELDA